MWIPEADAPTYRFRPSGALEFRDRRGRYQLVYGCTVDGYFDFWGTEGDPGYYDQARELFFGQDKETVDQLYVNCDEFRHLCDRCLELSGIDLDWIAPKMIAWLLFAHQVGDTAIEAALVLLNRPTERKYPPLPGGTALDSHTKLMAAIVGAAGGDMAKAVELAKKVSAKQFFEVSEEINWQRADTKAKGKAWVNQRLEEMRNQGQTTVLAPAEIAALRSKGKGG
ncbi:MAG: hypothetical protein F6K00_19665 [Leptolyngbya sp. SIOISBB]|nr:hypothetical protein [Leptolyngbya sp. SIOISBB]